MITVPLAPHPVPTDRTGVFSVARLDKRFGSTHAVKDVHLTFKPGRVHCLLGENGAGKSTIGKILSGLVRPDEGEILVEGVPLPPGDMTAARAAGIALVFQELSLAPHLSVRDNICLGVQPRHFPLRWRGGHSEAQLCRRVLSDLRLDVPLHTPVGVLPQAHQQLVEVAKALVSHPRLLILDEPTAMLDSHDRDRLFETIRRLRGRGVAFVLVTHHIDEVLSIGDDVSLLKDGRLVDSFAVTPELTVSAISARLTGRQETVSRGSQPQMSRKSISSKPLLSIEGVPTQDGCFEKIVLHAGTVTAIYGVVGCGREAIAHAVVGLQPPRSGIHMRLHNSAFRPNGPAQAAKRGVNYLPAGRAAHGLLPTLNVRENLMLRQLGVRAGTVLRRADESQRAIGQLARYRTRYRCIEDRITSLSGGNQQKVMLARCLGAKGAVLVLEDPTNGVDIGAKEDIHELLRREVEDGLALLLISSDLGETLTLSDVVHTMFAGKLVSSYAAPFADDHDIIVDVMGGDRTPSPSKVVHGVA